MKKSQIKAYADLFGKQMPIGKIKDAETRKEIILLATSLRKYGKEVDDDLEAIRARLIEGHEEEVQKWAQATNKAKWSTDITDEERKALIEEAEGYTEAVRINKEYAEATAALLNEEIEVNVRKVSLATIVDALIDAGILSEGASLDAVASEFKDFINE